MSQINNQLLSFEKAIEQTADFIKAYVPGKQVARLELLIDPIDQLDWLSAQSQDVRIFGANQDGSASIAGVGQAIVIKGQGKIDYPAIFKRLRSYLNPQYPYLQWYGGFCFDVKSLTKEWDAFGSWHFTLARFELASDGKRMMFCCNLFGDIDRKKILSELKALNTAIAAKDDSPEYIKREDKPPLTAWFRMVEFVLAKIQQGYCHKVVLARQTDFTFKQVLNPWQILKTLKTVSPNSYHFAFGFGDSVFLGASPERLYKRQGKNIISEALAGTNKAGDDPQLLLDSAKIRREHHIVVDAIDSALAPLCAQLKADEKPQVRQLSNGNHLSTGFAGTLYDGIQDEDILQSLHPTPALGGDPRHEAIGLINQLESFGRGWYGGPIGYVGLDWTEFVVGIRSGLVNGKKLSVYAGAGIVQGSNPKDEWDEIENKISNFIKIIK